MILDGIFLFIAYYCFYTGFNQGIIRLLFTSASVLVAVVLAMWFTPSVTSILQTALESKPPLLPIIAFFLTYFAAKFGIRFFVSAVEGFLMNTHINTANRLFGGLAMLGIGTLLFSAMIWFFSQANILPEKVRAGSNTWRFLEAYPTATYSVIQKLAPSLRSFWQYGLNTINQIDGSLDNATDAEKENAKPPKENETDSEKSTENLESSLNAAPSQRTKSRKN